MSIDRTLRRWNREVGKEEGGMLIELDFRAMPTTGKLLALLFFLRRSFFRE
jgi:hypothetical protein